MNADRSSSLLHDVEVHGTITFTGHLTFDGQLQNGDLIGEGLVIGPKAVIQGNVKATSLILHGSVTGEVSVVECCEIKGTANLTGSLVAGRLVVHDGAALQGGVVVIKGHHNMLDFLKA